MSLSRRSFLRGAAAVTAAIVAPATPAWARSLSSDMKHMSGRKFWVPPKNEETWTVYVVNSTGDRDALAGPAVGSILYNNTTDRMEVYDGSDWRLFPPYHHGEDICALPPHVERHILGVQP